MNLLVVGAGTVGSSVIGIAVKAGHNITVIEADQERAEACAERHDVRVLHGDIADEAMEEEAGLAHADGIVATTGDDSTNLMAMFLAREHGVRVLTSIVNYHSHGPLFEKLGARVLVDPEVLVAQHLFDLTMNPEAVDVTTLQHRGQVVEVTLGEGSRLTGKTVSEVRDEGLLGKRLFIVTVGRDDERFFPHPDTVLEAGDELLVFSLTTIAPADATLFTGEQAG
ncbi:MAG TPA: TrkA family potassium uptake protein [Gammaproteobacteria bacterium]|nr:TrkA family potassium uptake protein [Gammaproteobacteria bacterium]